MMESLAVILGKVNVNQQIKDTEQRKFKSMEESKEETGAVLDLRKFQKEIKEDLAAEIKSSQLEMKCVLQEIKEAWMEMELRLSTQASLVTLMKEVSHSLSNIKAFQNVPKNNWNSVAGDGDEQAFQYFDEKAGSIHKWECNGVSEGDEENESVDIGEEVSPVGAGLLVLAKVFHCFGGRLYH
ncbi:UNVERIFIED_CONTAM: hypothetical protein K2H54_055478 [Gekko kuhli]